MNDGNFLPAAEVGEFEGIFHQSLGLVLGGYLQGLHDSRVDLMLDPGKLAFRVLPDDGDIHIVVPGLDVGVGIAQVDVSKQV